jgi:hypothetical protein
VPITTGNLADWLGNALDKARSLLCYECAYTKLPRVVVARHKHSSYFVKESAKE